MVLCACWICGAMYILYCLHVGYAMLCSYGDIRMLDMRCCVHMILRTCCICSAMYIWCCGHVVHMVLCTYGVVCMNVHVVLCARGVVYMLCRWCYSQVVLCTCCTYSTSVHVVLYACHTCCVGGMQYYVRALCSGGIVTSVFIVL